MKRALLLGAFVLFGCAQAARGPSVTLTSSNGEERGTAAELATNATSCWLGELWSDALGADSASRPSDLTARCGAVLDAIGETQAGSYAPLRAADARLVEKIARTLEARGGGDFAPYVGAVAEASREQLRARRIADIVKRDAAGAQPLSVYHDDKANAVPLLDETVALAALLRFEGLHDAEAHAVALLLALDRFEIARGLPKHLKIVVTRGAAREVFGVAAPVVPADPVARSEPGAWLELLERIAAAGGHDVGARPASGASRADMETFESLAWNTALEAFADKLRALAPRLHPGAEITQVVHATIARVDEQLAIAESLARARNAQP